MEFHETLQKLRKSKGMTQEELAQALYVSRTAVSKWESGRGYPGIDSLKEISRYFSVSIDQLLSGEALLAIAETENRSNLQRVRRLLLGLADLSAVGLIALPLYPAQVDGHIFSVNLLGCSSAYRMIYFMLFLSLIVLGASKLILTLQKIQKGQRAVTACSVVVSIFSVLFLAMVREPYATALSFFLLLLKGLLLFRLAGSDF